MYLIGENSSRLMRLDSEYAGWYYDNVGTPPSILDDNYALSIELVDGEIKVKELTEEQKKKREELFEKIEKYNKDRDIWILFQAYERYGYEMAKWIAKVRKVEMPDNLYPCQGKEGQCNMFCARYMKGCNE